MHFLLPSIDIRTTGNEKDIDHNMNKENRKTNRRKSCSKNEPSLMYEFHENKNVSEEHVGSITTASHYIYVDSCPKLKV